MGNKTSDTNQWTDIDLGSSKYVTGIKILARADPDSSQYVKKFNVCALEGLQNVDRITYDIENINNCTDMENIGMDLSKMGYYEYVYPDLLDNFPGTLGKLRNERNDIIFYMLNNGNHIDFI